MNQTIYEEMGGSYSMVGEYRLPDLAVNREEVIIGPWGQRHLRWLKRNRRVTFTNLLTTGKLYDYLREIDAQASGQLDVLITQMARTEGVTEQLKDENQMEWVRRMNNIRNRAEEIVSDEFIYC